MRRCILVLALLLLLGAPRAFSADADAPVTVAAAVSLKEAMTDLVASYKAGTGSEVRVNFGSSGQLAAQVKSGAPIDVFISAAEKQVNELIDSGLVDAKSRRVVAGNELVLIVPADAKDPKGFADLADAHLHHVAIGEPKTVPAGQYAMQVLTKLKLTHALDGRVVYGSCVRQVLDYVKRGEVDAGIVYATDAADKGEGQVKVVATADPKTHEPIEYPAVIVKASPHQAAAAKFLEFLGTDEARRIFVAKGFTPPAAAKDTTSTSAPTTRP